jgi:hypothetical protein
MINMEIRGHLHKLKEEGLISLPRSMIVWADQRAMLKKSKSMEMISLIIYSLKDRH